MPNAAARPLGKGGRLCYVVSSPMTAVAFLRDHMAAALAEGYQVDLVANAVDPDFLQRVGLSEVRFHAVAIPRSIAPQQDLSALWRLFILFRREQFTIVHSVSPKAGLLSMVAGWLARIPHRIHTFTGQVWVTRTGWRRRLLKSADWLLARLTTRVLVDSPSQRNFLIAEGVVDQAKAEVIGIGGICGVDVNRFRPDPTARHAIRTALGIPEDAQALLFLGRQNRDKGIFDLARAFVEIGQRFPQVYWVLVGPDEEGVAGEVERLCESMLGRIRRVDFTSEPERYMAAADIFCLPSYREGFGMVVIEAAAAGLPAVASRIYGLTDAVVEGETGLFHQPGDVAAIVRAVENLLENPSLCLRLGEQARVRVIADFSSLRQSRGLLDFYSKVLADES